jgi:hypothetical protein
LPRWPAFIELLLDYKLRLVKDSAAAGFGHAKALADAALIGLT